MSCLLRGALRRHGGVGASVGVRSLASVPSLPPAVAEFVKGAVEECKPSGVHVVTGTPEETANILAGLEMEGMVKKLPKYENCWLARTDPKDVGSRRKQDSDRDQKSAGHHPIPANGVKSQLGNWMSESDWDRARQERFPGSMAGRTMFVIPFSMGPVGSPLTKYGCSAPLVNSWPCNPEKVLISHLGYGGNSLLGKKCFALRIASPAAFPSAWRENQPGHDEARSARWKVECVGDDIAWMKFDSQDGFFGVAPGTSDKTTLRHGNHLQNTVFTNVGRPATGSVVGGSGLSTRGRHSHRLARKTWKKSPTPCAHPNSRFCAPAGQCPIIDPQWESEEGVPIDAIIFGGRRPEGVPLVYESFSWKHGVFVGAAMRSEATAAAEHQGKVIMHDPFAMRPFFRIQLRRLPRPLAEHGDPEGPHAAAKDLPRQLVQEDPAAPSCGPDSGKTPAYWNGSSSAAGESGEDQAAKKSIIGWVLRRARSTRRAWAARWIWARFSTCQTVLAEGDQRAEGLTSRSRWGRIYRGKWRRS
ncbi:hypothetical protein WMY93_030027 [Mugilogobius chulae]|uniref:phosphoenolpyruvate carboxykinase (GTP) n=1 Tax=Mugilogobius chulae TaxID=88201 RepID=A0AAW0MTD9_9GOBI